jgi:hypothetical protein
VDFDLPAEFNMVRPPTYDKLSRNQWVVKRTFKRQHRDNINVCCCELEEMPLPDGGTFRTGCGEGCLNR